jgi:hypothetical protein
MVSAPIAPCPEEGRIRVRSGIGTLLAVALVIGALIGALVVILPARTTPARAQATQNVVLIVTDDQRWDSSRYKPTVNSALAAQGVTFTNAFDNNPAM